MRIEVHIKGQSVPLEVPRQRNIAWLIEAALIYLN